MIFDTRYLSIAGFIIGVKFHAIEWPYGIEYSFRDWFQSTYFGFLGPASTKKADYWIEFHPLTTPEIIINHKLKKHFINIFQQKNSSAITSYYHLSQHQIQLILRKIIQKLLTKENGLILHASASLVNRKAFVFLGPSGAGKSTTVKLLSKNHKPLADDALIIKKEGNKYYLYQTPFMEKSYFLPKKSEPIELGAVFFIHKSKEYGVEKITDKNKITNKLIEQFLTEEDDLRKQLPYLLKMLKEFDHFYHLKISLKDSEQFSAMIQSLK